LLESPRPEFDMICLMATFANNSKALFDYEILERFTLGLELLGLEVKSIKEGKMNLRGAFVAIRGNEAYLVSAEIPPYQPKNAPQDYDATRARRLLLTKDEVEKLRGAEQTKGLTIVPISVYNKGKKLKVELAVVRGKKQYDKREDIKKRQSQRDIERSLKD